MRRSLVSTAVSLGTAAAAALVLTGCGSAEPSDGAVGTGAPSPSTSPSPSSSPSSSGARPTAAVAGCDASSPAVQQARTLTTADLFGDGTSVPVKVTAASADGCADTVFAAVSGGFLSLPLQGVVLDGPVSAATVPGREGQVLEARQTSPRGGYQVHLYGVADGRLGEVLASGHPLVPFVATDTTPMPVSLSCVAGGLAVTRAVTHEPAGIAFAYDLRRTTYRVVGNDATATGSSEVADNVLPAQLDQRLPGAEGRLTGC